MTATHGNPYKWVLLLVVFVAIVYTVVVTASGFILCG
jgi:hypothetical protein